jgi:hypothetical protein
LSYRCEVLLKNASIPVDAFVKWNADILKLTEYYDQQILITR